MSKVKVHNYISAIRRLAPQIGIEPNPITIKRHIEQMHKSGASYSYIVNTSIALESYCFFRGRPIKLGRLRKPHYLVRGTLSEYMRERSGGPGDWLFVCLGSGKPYAPQNLRKTIRTAARRANLNKRVYPHLLRHALAINLLHRGAHPLAIKEQLGHAFVEITMIYVHSNPGHTLMQYRMFAPSYL